MKQPGWVFTISAILAVGASVIDVAAETVELQSPDKSVSIIGDLLDFDGERYRISTALGTMELASDVVICLGEACPVLSAKFSDFSVGGSRVLADKLIPGLLDDYAFSRDASNNAVQNGNGIQTVSLDSAEAGSAVIRVAATTTDRGLSDVSAGQVTFALAARSANRQEIESFDAASLGNLKSIEQEHIIALDALVVVVHPDNPVRAISEAEVAAVFAGNITNWQQLGGPDLPITLFGTSGDTGTSEMFDNLVMAPNGLTRSGSIEVENDDRAVSESVWSNLGGIGFTSHTALDNGRALDIEEACGLRTPANAFTIKTEEYPYSQVLYAYTSNQSLPSGPKDFLEYVASQDGQFAARSLGFVDQEITSQPINQQGFRLATAVATSESSQDLNALQDMMQTLQSAERLSATFRFNTGSSQLNARAQADTERLADYLETTNLEGKELLFVGFTDSVGKSELNVFLSQNRADLVLQSVMNARPGLADRVSARAIGAGEIAPVGCNESNRGRTINRRVEVWLVDAVG